MLVNNHRVKSVDLSPSGPLRFAGIAETNPHNGGIRPARLPAWALAQTDAAPLPIVSSMLSGGRIEFDTDSTTVEIDCQLITVKSGDQPVMPVVFEATVNGSVTASHAATNYHLIHTPDPVRPDVTIIPGGRERVVLSGLPAGTKSVGVWFPPNAGIEIASVGIDDGATATASAPDTRRSWVHYGSSISHCMESEHPKGVWPVIVADRENLNLTNLGLGGQCHLDQFAARMMRDSGADLLSMKVGINVVNADTMRDRTFVPALHGFIDTVREGAPDTPFVVVSPIFCPGHEEGFGPSLRNEEGIYTRERPGFLSVGALNLQRIRGYVEKVVQQRRDAGDTNIHYVDGLRLFGADDVHDMPDLLHPNRAGYARMGERFHRIVFGSGLFPSA